MKDAELQAKTLKKQDAMDGLRTYDLYVAGLSQAEASAEQLAPGKCFQGLKTQFQAHTWRATPPGCSFSKKKTHETSAPM